MTLTQTATLTKRSLLVSAIAIFLITTIFISYKIWYAYNLAHTPPVEEKPDTKFGSLPPLEFPQSTVSSSNFSYSLDTTTGGLPRIGQDVGFEKIIRVYYIIQSFATLLAPDRSQTLAEKFGISNPAEILNETKYQFKDMGKRLTVDLDNGNFSYTNEATMSAKTNLDDDNKLVSDFEQVLSNLNILKDDLKKGRTKVVPLKTAGGKYIPTPARLEAEGAQISLWPAPIDKKSIFTPDFNKSLVSATVLGSANNLENYLSLDFTYYPIDLTTFATYPTKKAEIAFEDLKTGKGVVVVEPSKPQVSITSVYLGYYMPKNYTPYLQPIFVFEGPNFVAYVSAIGEQSVLPPAK